MVTKIQKREPRPSKGLVRIAQRYVVDTGTRDAPLRGLLDQDVPYERREIYAPDTVPWAIRGIIDRKNEEYVVSIAYFPFNVPRKISTVHNFELAEAKLETALRDASYDLEHTPCRQHDVPVEQNVSREE